MKLTVLGCWAPYPRAGGACSGYLLSGGGSHILLDCGHGVMGKLQAVHDFRKLDAVFISHLHPDHDAGYAQGKHLTAAQAGRLARAAGVKRLLLTHFWPEYDLKQLLQEAAAEYPAAELCSEGKSYSIEF